MKITVEKLPKAEVKLIIEVDDEELASYREKAAVTLGAHVQVPGFRNGKAPAFQVEAHVGKPNFFQEFLRVAIPLSYTKAVEQEKIPAVSRPKINVVSEYPFKYEAIVATPPEVMVKGYEKVKVPTESTDVSEKELEGVLLEMKRFHATFKPRDGAVQKGDKVEIDFEGVDEKGAVVANTKSKNHPLFIGEGSLVPGFEEQLVGMKVGDKKKFPITFPADFHFAGLRGKKIEFAAELKKADEPILPVLDEAFVEKAYGQKISIADFQKRLREDVENQKKADQKRRREDKLIEEWLKLAKVELSDVLIDEEIDFLIEQLRAETEQRGIPFDQYLEFLKSKKRDVRQEKLADAKKRLTIRFILNEIMRLEKVAVTPEEIEAGLQKMIQGYSPEEQTKVLEAVKKDRYRLLQVENNLKLDKLFDRFLG